MSVLVVIAKYKEDVSWIQNIKHPVIVYDKCETPDVSFIPRPNIGREAETLLHVIITHYHEFPDAIIFLQGDPRGNPIKYTYEEVINSINQEQGEFFSPFMNEVHEGNFSSHWLKRSCILHQILFDYTNRVYYASGAQYIITKNAVLNRPIEFYQLIHSLILKFGNTPLDGALKTLHEGIDAWTLEVLWYDIFNETLPLKSTAIEDLQKMLTETFIYHENY
jgi:hypothetical protein